MTSGEKISEQRKLHKMSQAELAEKVGVTRSVIIKWESDVYCPSPANADKLSELFGVPFCYLFDDEACEPDCTYDSAAAAVCILREKNAEVASALEAHRRNCFLHKKRAMIALLSVFCALSIFVTACLGIIVFPDISDNVSFYMTTASVSVPHFVMSVVLSVLLFAALVSAVFWKDEREKRQ